MKKVLFLFLFLFNFSFANDETILKSAGAFATVMRGNSNTKALVSNAKAILIFPSVKKVGFVIGGMYGSGVAIYKNDMGYTISGVEITNASLGLQIGYEDNYLVVFIMSDQIINDMRKAEIKLGGDVTALAGNASANIGTLNAFTQDMYVYTDKSGVFLGASLGGVVISSDNKRVYDPNSYGYKNLISTITGEF